MADGTDATGSEDGPTTTTGAAEDTVSVTGRDSLDAGATTDTTDGNAVGCSFPGVLGGTQQWRTELGGADGDDIAADVVISDSGMVGVGGATWGGRSRSDGWVAQLDTDGASMWEWSFQSPEDDDGVAVRFGPDGALFSAGHDVVDPGGTKRRGHVEMWAAKHLPEGVLQWIAAAPHDVPTSEVVVAIDVRPNGELSVLTELPVPGEVPARFTLRRFDSDGMLASTTPVDLGTPGDQAEHATDAEALADGSFLVAGSLTFGWILQWTSSLELTWSYQLPNTGSLNRVVSHAGGAVVVSRPFGSDEVPLFVHLNGSGEKTAEYAWGEKGSPVQVFDAAIDQDANLIVVGDDGAGRAAWVRKYALDGALLWAAPTDSEEPSTRLRAVAIAEDCSIVAAGQFTSADGSQDAVVVNLAP